MGEDPHSVRAMTPAQRVGFFVLCAMGASGWLVEGAWPSALPVAAREVVHEAVIAAAVCGFGWRGFARWRAWARLAMASMCLLGVPAAMIQSARGGVPEIAVAELFALVPAVVVVIAAGIEVGRQRDLGPGLGGAVTGLAGVLLLLQFALPGTWREARLDGVVVLAAILAATASVWMYRVLAGFRVSEAVLVCCVANAVFWLAMASARGVGLVGGFTWGSIGMECAKAALFDLPQILLLLWLMREVAPVKLAARWLLVPLLTVVEGYALLRPELTARSVAGAVLAFLGAWRLMASDGQDEEPKLVLR